MSSICYLKKEDTFLQQLWQAGRQQVRGGPTSRKLMVGILDLYIFPVLINFKVTSGLYDVSIVTSWCDEAKPAAAPEMPRTLGWQVT